MRHRIPRRPRTLFLIVAALCLAAPAPAETEDFAHLQIFVTVPATASTPTELGIARIEIVGRVETHVTAAERAVLVTDELRGRLTLLLDAAFPADVVDSVRVVWGAASVQVDTAPTEPVLEGRVSAFALGRQLESGSATVLHLYWDPDATDPATEDWMPDLRLDEPQKPPVTAMLLVSQEASGTISIVDRRTHVVVGAIATSGAPRGMAWATGPQRLFVAVGERNEIAVVDLGDARVSRRVPLDFGDEPTRLLLSSDGTRLFVLCPGRDTLVVLSTASLQEVGRILLAPGVVAMAEQPRTGRIFVSAVRARTIEVVDPQRLTVVASLARAEAPGELAFAGDDGALAVASREGRSVEVIDPVTGIARTLFTVCGPVRGLAHQPRTDRLYAVLDLCREVSVLRIERSLEIASLPLPSVGGLPTIDPEDRTLYVPLPGENVVLRINTSHGQDATRIETAARPYQVVIP